MSDDLQKPFRDKSKLAMLEYHRQCLEYDEKVIDPLGPAHSRFGCCTHSRKTPAPCEVGPPLALLTHRGQAQI